MRIVRSREFVGSRPWESVPVAQFDGISAKIHWTDKPYIWHTNEGTEVFAVVDGRVRMRFRNGRSEDSVLLAAGDIFIAEEGDEHVAEPVGEARILVIERADSP